MTVPVLVWTLIAVNTALFGLQSLHPAVSIDDAALVPGALAAAPLQQSPRLLTSMFTHGNLLHLLFNMAALYRFGAPLERAWGPAQFSALYLVSGLGTNVIYSLFNRDSNVGLVGASGAISGVMAAYFFALDNDAQRMTTWLLYQLVNAVLAVQTGISYTAHLIGFAVGMVFYFARQALLGKTPE